MSKITNTFSLDEFKIAILPISIPSEIISNFKSSKVNPFDRANLSFIRSKSRIWSEFSYVLASSPLRKINRSDPRPPAKKSWSRPPSKISLPSFPHRMSEPSLPCNSILPMINSGLVISMISSPLPAIILSTPAILVVPEFPKTSTTKDVVFDWL